MTVCLSVSNTKISVPLEFLVSTLVRYLFSTRQLGAGGESGMAWLSYIYLLFFFLACLLNTIMVPADDRFFFCSFKKQHSITAIFLFVYHLELPLFINYCTVLYVCNYLNETSRRRDSSSKQRKTKTTDIRKKLMKREKAFHAFYFPIPCFGYLLPCTLYLSLRIICKARIGSSISINTKQNPRCFFFLLN
jgi:hypothetical protein